MRSAPALAAALLLLSAAPVRAQTMTTTSPGSCSGGLMGYVGLQAPATNGGTLQSIGTAYTNLTFGAAECQCPNEEINLQIQLKMALTMGSGNFEMWVGTGCDNYDTRTNATQTTCEQVFPAGISYNSFTLNGTASSGEGIRIPIPSRTLFAPKKTADFCSQTRAGNAVYIILWQSDPRMPVGTCTLPLNEVNELPAAPVSPTAQGGDGAVTVSWTPPPTGSNMVASYQILCADADGNPLPGKLRDPAYSSCDPTTGIVRRRAVLFTANTGITTTTDGGVTDAGTTLDASTAGFDDPLEPRSLGTQQVSEDMAVTDGGVDMMPATGPTAFASTLNPNYICSDEIKVFGTGGALTTRITGLTNGATYRFVVLSINDSGNVSASTLVEGVPQSTEDLWRRFRAAGGRGGFCAAIPGALFDERLLPVEILAVALLLAWLIQRARRRRA
jgi:hypothetical protein